MAKTKRTSAMQRLLFEDTAPPTAFKAQLLKWIGNKQRFAGKIVSYFPARFGRYFEPFLGSGAVLATLAPKTAVGSDNYASLVEIWRTLKRSPETLKAWIDLAEAYRITQALRECNGNRSAAARLLGIGRRTLYAKMDKLDITPTWRMR